MCLVPLSVFALCLQVVLAGDITSSVSIPEPLEDSRRNVLATLKLEISNLVSSTKEINATTAKLKKRCDDEYQEHLKTFNDLLANIRDVEDVQQTEEEYERTYFEHEELSGKLKEIYNLTELLKLKKTMLVEDINIATNRKVDYDACAKQGPIINFQPDVMPQFGQRSLQSQDHKDRATVLYERKKIGLEIKRDQEAYTNVEEREKLKYLAGACRRQIELIKQLIENLRKYPSLSRGIKQMKKELQELKRKIEEAKGELGQAYNEFLRLVEEVKALQLEYESVKNEISCFYNLSQWHVDNIVESVVKTENK